MKNDKWLLGIIIFLSSCSNNMFQIEESSLDKLEEKSTTINKEEVLNNISLLNTYDSMDTIFYPAQTFFIDHAENGELVVNVPRLNREYIYNTEGKHKDLPEYNFSINTGCYIQYRLHIPTNSTQNSPWYYYHPDTIQSTIPYYIKVPNYHPDDYRTLRVYLNATKLPRADFDLRGVLADFGQERIYGSAVFNGKSVKTMTEWFPAGWSYNPYGYNYNGFDNNSNINDPNRKKIDVPVELHLYVTVYLQGGHGNGTYIFKLGNQTEVVKYDSSDTVVTCTLTTKKILKNVYIGSQCTTSINYEGKEYSFNFYIAPEYRGGTLHAYNEAYIY